MKIRLPHPEKKRALIVVDMQAGFLPEHTRWIVPNAKAVIEQGEYDVIVETVFEATPGSLWDLQTNWLFKFESTVPELSELLKNKNSVRLTKTTKSAFQGSEDLLKLFKSLAIDEVHIIGVDIEDCVLATAFDSFDAGFFTYVIEEAVESSNGPKFREMALEIMRNVDLTNSSEFIKAVNEVNA